MKLAIAAAAALLLSAGVAAAQPAAPAAPPIPQPPPLVSNCPALPAEIPMPDGATADMAAMGAFEAYMQAQSNVLACRRNEVNALNAQISPRLTSFNAAVTSWPAEVAEYNAAHPPRRRR